MRRFVILSHPRSGSTPLTERLRSHPLVWIPTEEAGEALSADQSLPLSDDVEQLLAELDRRLRPPDAQRRPLVGFKLFPQHLSDRKLGIDRLFRYLQIEAVILLYRETAVEAIVSEAIARKTGKWYSTIEDGRLDTVALSEEEIHSNYAAMKASWLEAFHDWPIEVNPLFIKFEDMGDDCADVQDLLLNYLRIPCSGIEEVYAKRQNPAPLSEKLSNFTKLPKGLLELTLDLPLLFKNSVDERFRSLPVDISQMVPNREPLPPTQGIRYRVAEPYMSPVGRENILDALDAGCVSSAGVWPQKMSQMLRRIYGLPVAQPCANGFASLMLALQCAHIGKDDEVVVPSFTMVAVPNAVSFMGATPVFVDNSEPDRYNPNWAEIERVGTERTKAVIIAHTYGVPASEIQEIAAQCKKHNWILIEDISECVGVRILDGQLLGTFGDYACASLYANKIIHGADAGFVLSRRPEDASRLSSICNHGFTKSYHFLHYEISPNCKVNGLGAAMVAGCLTELGMVMEHRHWLAQKYRTELQKLPIELMPACGMGDTPWVFGVHCKSKDERTLLRKHLLDHGIETRDYFFPLHLQPAYQHLNSESKNFPIAEQLSQTGFYLPTYTNMCAEDVAYICQIVCSFYNPNEPLPLMPTKLLLPHIRVKPEKLETTVRTFSSGGQLITEQKNHALAEMLRLRLDLDQWLLDGQNWDDAQILLNRIVKEETRLQQFPKIAATFDAFAEHFRNIQPEDTLEFVDQSEVQQGSNSMMNWKSFDLLVKLLKEKAPKVLVDFNCQYGQTTVEIAAHLPAESTKIVAVDSFEWKESMERDSENRNVFLHNGFANKFRQTVNGIDSVEQVIYKEDDNALRTALKNLEGPIDLVVFQLSHSSLEELTRAWNLLKQFLTTNRTMVLFLGINSSHVEFFTIAAIDFVEFARVSNAKAVKFIIPQQQDEFNSAEQEKNPEEQLLERKLWVAEDPGWDHHHGNAFSQAVAVIRHHFHDDKADCMFIPAVEQFICDNPAPLQGPWIGIVHSIENHPEQFYVPDLARLCTPAYSHWFTTCKGLFTLTRFQANYLNQHLKLDVRIPIQPIKYPMIPGDISNGPLTTVVLDRLASTGHMDVVMIGNFGRDFDYFAKVTMPDFVDKKLLCGEESIQDWFDTNSANASAVTLLPRATDSEYEELLRNSVAFLALKYDGAANTLILECINRNCPILVPRMSACTEYIGDEYPLLYDQTCADLTELLTLEKIKGAIEYLENMDKREFGLEKLVATIKKSAVLTAVTPVKRKTFDVTISLCSYKRTHNLPMILDSLWNHQTYDGTVEIIIWNNNYARKKTLNQICKTYLKQSNGLKSLKVVHSTENFHCIIRAAMPQLMKSNDLLICDDDIQPGEDFIDFFMKARCKHPNDLLCLRGHYFLPHELSMEEPAAQWIEYDCVRFADDHQPERFIHFIHADVCLITKGALREFASVTMPDDSFALVDDYWMSFVLNCMFCRKLRKLSIGVEDAKLKVLTRTDDSDDPRVAMHKRRDVWDARIRMYQHHMLQGWPDWEAECFYERPVNTRVKLAKQDAWKKRTVGFNIYSHIGEQELDKLTAMGITTVRVGAVTAGRTVDYEFCDMRTQPESVMEHLGRLVDLLTARGMQIIITMHDELADGEVWQRIASEFSDNPTVIGYDVVNEPYTAVETDLHWTEVETTADHSFQTAVDRYCKIIDAIRKTDKNTPIVLQPTFWGSVRALEKFCCDNSAIRKDDNLILSIHFYEPRNYTWHSENGGRFTFPGSVHLFEGAKKEQPLSKRWDAEVIMTVLETASNIAASHGLQLFIGETGVSRQVDGAERYLEAVLDSCARLGLSVCVYGYRDPDWDAMDYELGPITANYTRLALVDCPILQKIANAVARCP